MGRGAQSPVEQRIVGQMEGRAGSTLQTALGAAQPQADRAPTCKQDGVGAVLGLPKLPEARQRMQRREIRPWVDDHDASGNRRIPQRGIIAGRPVRIDGESEGPMTGQSPPLLGQRWSY